MLPSTLIARLGALCYIAWGLFHVNVAHDIYTLGSTQTGIARGRPTAPALVRSILNPTNMIDVATRGIAP
jgi:hypothetical protein